MTTKTKKPEAADFPDPPEAFQPSDFRDPGCAWLRGYAEVKADNADTSGADKAYRAVRPLAWAELIVGGSVHAWRQRLAEAQFHRQKTQGRIGGQVRQEKDSTEARGELAAADKDVARLTALISAAEAWPGPDNMTLNATLDAATRHHEEWFQRMAPHRAHPEFPVPDGWEKELLESEKARTAETAAFNAGRARLDKLGDQVREARTAAFDALAGSLAHVVDRLGGACAKIISDSDPEFLAAFPARAPDELIPIFNRAVRVSEIMNELGASHDVGLARFYRSCGEDAAQIVQDKVGLAPVLPRENTGRRGSKSDAEIMGASF